MPKPKPLPPAVLALQKAKAELPNLQRRLEKLLADGDDEQEKDELEKDELEKDEQEMDELASSSEGEGSAEDSEGQTANDGTLDDEDVDEEDSDDDDDLEEAYQYDHPLPNHYQIEIEGVCVVTADLIRETLTTYNEDAIKWIKDHLHRITPEGRKTADISYRWIQRTLASHHHGQFEINGDRLMSRRHHSFPKSLLEGDLFETLHAIMFSAHPELGQSYADAAAAAEGHIPPASIEACLEEPTDRPGLYGFNTHAEAGQKFYIGRSKDIKKRLAQHSNPSTVGVNSIVRAAKTKATAWTTGALITFDDGYGHVPQGIWSALETSLIACHGSTTGPGQAQINIVDRCILPRPRMTEEVLRTLHEDFKSGKPLDEISKGFNIDPSYVRKLMTGRSSYAEFSRYGKHERLHDWLVIQRLRIEEPYEQPVAGDGDRRGRVIPLYPRMKSLEFGYIGKNFKSVEKSPSRSLDQRVYPLRTRGVSEMWELRDYSMEITANRPLAPLVFPVDEYRQEAERMYANAFAGGIPANVWTIATTDP